PRAGQTLVHWGDLLLKTIARATRSPDDERRDHLTPEGVLVSMERAGPAGSKMVGFEAAERLSAGDHTERWLLREGLWAGAFPAPSYRELLSWSVRALPWSIVTHFGERYWQSVGGATQRSQMLKPEPNSLVKRPWHRARIVTFVTAIRHFIV